MEYEAVIGLEIHVELSTNSKMFCGCKVSFGGEVNTRVCPVCLGMPGTLPVPNKKAVEDAIKIGLALDCGIAEHSIFHRKNYFYPDMPKDYQISQFDLPFCVDGEVDVEVGGEMTRVGITRVHLEEDTGKMIHVGGEGRIAGSLYSLVDFNRAGTPLVEIVSEPDIRSAEQAKLYVQKLKSILEHLGVSDVNMEEGSLRCDANVSIRPKGTSEFGTKTEIKNLNSFRSLERGLAYEIERQAEALDSGEKIVQETRHWDPGKAITTSLRSKEEAHDYRYFPEPDMPPMTFTNEYVEGLRAGLPELPDARRIRFISEYGINEYTANVLTSSKALGDFYENTVSQGVDPLEAANWIMGEFSFRLNERNLDVKQSPVSEKQLGELLLMMKDGTISGKIAKEVFEEMFETGKSAKQVVEEKGLVQISDESALEEIVDQILANNPSVVEDFRAGKEKAFGFLVGQVMKETRGRANPQLVNTLLRKKLS